MLFSQLVSRNPPVLNSCVMKQGKIEFSFRCCIMCTVLANFPRIFFAAPFHVHQLRFDRFDTNRMNRLKLWPRFKNEEGSCVFSSRISTSGGLCRVGWKCCRFDSIRSNRHESLPLLSTRRAGRRFARDTTPCESSRVVKCFRRIDSVFGVLNMDDALGTACWSNGSD